MVYGEGLELGAEPPDCIKEINFDPPLPPPSPWGELIYIFSLGVKWLNNQLINWLYDLLIEGVEGNFSVQISEQDHVGPLKNKPVEDRDYYLLFSVLFLLMFGTFMFAKSSYRQLVWDRIQAIQWQRFLQWFRRDKQD